MVVKHAFLESHQTDCKIDVGREFRGWRFADSPWRICCENTRADVKGSLESMTSSKSPIAASSFFCVHIVLTTIPTFQSFNNE